jgi:hypothetical protein
MLDGLKSMLFEEDKPKGKVLPASQAAKAVATPVMPTFSPETLAGSSSAAVSTGNNEAYDRLRQATQFEGTRVGQILQKYLAPLKDVPLDTALKMKTAITQAVAIDKITKQEILDTFETLRTQLRGEQNSFEGWKQSKVNKIADLTQKITDLQKQLAEVSVELSNQQTKLSVGQNQFTLALANRSDEIEQQARQFAGYLQ